MASSSSTPLCKVCEDPLVTQPDDDGEAPAPDDLELPCGCHYHWQCLLDQAGHIALALTCPSCDKYLPSNEAGPSVTNPVFHTPQHQTTIRTRYASEGGVEDGFDILPTLTEEAYLESHPEERRPRAFHTLCGEGDVLGAVELLSDAAAEEGGDVVSILSYRDPLARGRSALHLALERGQEDAVWLLLFLGAPRLPLASFPQEALDAARGMGIDRMPERRGEDLRAVRDDDGRSPEDYARALPELWGRLVGAGVLRP